MKQIIKILVLNNNNLTVYEDNSYYNYIKSIIISYLYSKGYLNNFLDELEIEIDEPFIDKLRKHFFKIDQDEDEEVERLDYEFESRYRL